METNRKILVRYRRGESIRGISRDLNIARNTVRSIVYSTERLQNEYIRTVQPMPKLGEYIETLEKLLRANKYIKPPKNGKALFEELQTLGYKGSYSAVSRYIHEWKVRTSTKINAYIPLSFAPGEAYQFDWSSEEVIVDGDRVAVKVAHFILCYSRKKFVYIYPNETQEMVFDSHVRAFKFFGGTPRRGIYDNMKTAIHRVLKGSEREWNTNFEKLCAHYLIEPTACTPSCGNEKGRIERQVQIGREQFFTPIPIANSLAELNDRLMSQLIQYNSKHKHPDQADKTLDEVFKEEQDFLVAVPHLFDGYKETDVRVSSTCLARFDNNSYSVECAYAGKVVQCRAYADKVVFIYNSVEIGKHNRKFGRGQTLYDPAHYFPLLAKKPGALRNGAPFIAMDLPQELKEVRKHLEQRRMGMRDFAHILSYIPTEGLESVIAACKEALAAGIISKDIILNILLRKQEMDHANVIESPSITILDSLKLNSPVQADCSLYNVLLKVGGRQ